MAINSACVSPRNMRNTAIHSMNLSILIIFLICFSVGVYSQTSVEECFKKPTTITLNSPDLKTDPEFDGQLKKISKNLAEGEKLYIYTYSKGSFGTSGLNTINSTVESRADQIFKPKDRYEIKAGGYRFEASVELFVLNEKCQELANRYESDPGMSISEVDFSDAPLGLSVFPKEIRSLIVKEGNLDCDAEDVPDDCWGYVTFYVIVDRDGRVLYSTLLSVWSQNEREKPKVISRAKNALTNTVFEPYVKDGIARYMRGGYTITVWPRRFLKSVKKPQKP